MHWKDMKAIGHKDIDGITFDLSHLQDRIVEYTIEASGKHPELIFSILFQYSSHCISWGSRRGSRIDFNYYGDDRLVVDERGMNRCFCNDRYDLSLKLPQVFESMLERKCYFTGKDNWLIVEVVDRITGNKEDYDIFFNVTRQSGSMLRLYIESAYVRSANYINTRPSRMRKKDKIKAKTLFGKKLRKEQIRQPS